MKHYRLILAFGIVLIIAESVCFWEGQIVAGLILLFAACFLLGWVMAR